MSSLLDSRTTRVLITGGTGWLAQHLHLCLSTNKLYGSNVEIHLTYRNSKPEWNCPDHCHSVDIAEADVDVWGVILQSVVPDVIVHTAAISSPVACEMDQPRAVQVNVTSPSGLVKAIKMYCPNCIFINCSTDLVYGGPDAGTVREPSIMAPYKSDPTLEQPSSVYGRTKLAFEEVVSTLPYGVSLRLSNMIGPSHCYRAGGSKFLQWLLASASDRNFVTLKNDERRSFVSVFDVIAVIERFVTVAVNVRSMLVVDSDSLADLYRDSNCFRPVLNVGGPEGLSRFDLAKLVAESVDIELVVVDTDPGVSDSRAWQVASVTCEEMDANYPPKASAPRNAIMNSDETGALLSISFSNIKDLLQSKRCV